MFRPCLAVLLPALLAAAEPADKYLSAARAFVDTLIEKGTDRYGAVHSPLFASMLDLDTMSLPGAKLDELLADVRGRQVRAIGHGLPEPPAGIRPGDRAPIGANLEHDIMLLRSMYVLSEITGDARYSKHADAALRFWLMNCQSPATGLMASGEHMSWDFHHEKAYGDVHEVYRRFPFFENLYAIDPFRTLRIADGMWLAQIGNKKHGDFSRHAQWSEYNAGTGGAPDMGFPRHSGFYVWTYANAYAQSRDPKYIDRIEVLVESRTAIRLQPFSLILEPGEFHPVHSIDPALRILLWDAAELVPSRKSAWQGAVRQLDERAFNQLPASAGTRSVWDFAYGDSGVSGHGLEYLTRYHQTRDERFLALAEQVADKHLQEGWPADKSKLWPRAPGQAISLLLSLSREAHIPAAKQKAYKEFATKLADISLALFTRNKLFRASGSSNHYESITGADDLLYALLQLHCALIRPDRPLPHIDVNL
ncbi:MAG: hypothetical protein IT168_19800 [Bryobacterales bacterium]|nr:hypothetical protein [Bryobacterales bacterium]